MERDDRKMRSGLSVMLGLVGLVKPLMGFMCLAVFWEPWDLMTVCR